SILHQSSIQFINPVHAIESSPFVYFCSRDNQRLIALDTETMSVMQYKISCALHIPLGIIGVHRGTIRIHGIKDKSSGNMIYTAPLPPSLIRALESYGVIVKSLS
ncbi:hypothetical protein PFISCL1PPCAC_672, partial [Pristionchus fissidentatus]